MNGVPTLPSAIVVTGLGCVTPLGPDLATTWSRLIAGAAAAAPVTLFDVAGCRCRNGAQAVLPELPLPAKQLSRLTRGSRLALPAAREALAQAGLLDERGRSVLAELPVSVSTTGGGMALGEQFLRGVLAKRRGPGQYRLVAHYSAQRQMLDLQEFLGFRGPVTIIANACASGANAIGHARDLIRAGRAECVLTGGYEALTELIYVGFDCLQALSTERCRPFDRQRSGLLLGEAAAFLVVESAAHAQARGARILCELAGYGHATDLHHLTQPHPTGGTLVNAARTALQEAGVAPGYVNAHGTATPLNDGSEAAAYATIFQQAPHPGPLPASGARETHFESPLPVLRGEGQGEGFPRISSTKAAIGHTLGAAGAVEAVFAIQTLRTGELPPQLNLREAEPAVAGQLVQAGERAANLPATMSANLGFGGSNAALVFARGGMGQPVACGRSLPALAVAGTGQVLPGDAEPTLSVSGATYPACRVDLKQERLARWQNEARLRRASPISLFMVAAARQALDAAGDVDPARVGIVAAYGTGAVVLSRRFFEGVIKNGQRFASPNLFPETVFNSPTSHLAAVLGVAGPCYSVVGDESAWVNAIGVAATWLANGTVEHALVVGAEEFDPIILDAYAKVRWLRRAGRFVPAEGAGALVLRRPRAGEQAGITSWAEGFTYRNAREARRAAAELVRTKQAGAVRTAAHNWFAEIERELLPDAPALPYHGNAFTASAAWDTVAALARPGATWLPIWGLNEQCSALLLQGG